MKIFINNKVYVSQKDIWFLLKSEIFYIPDNIIKEICPYGVISINPLAEQDFFIFETEEAKSFFRKEHSIINYTTYKNMSINEIYKIIDNNSEKAFELSKKMITVSDLEIAKKLYYNMISLNYNNESLYDLIDLKKGLLRIELPEKIKKDPDEKYKVFLKKMLEPIKYY